MAKRNIVIINEGKCNGCGLCIANCPEGALQIIDGKLHLISDMFCDGLGACIGHCPEGAITIEEREAETYDEEKVMSNIVKQGENVIKAHLKHLRSHGQQKLFAQAISFLNDKNIGIAEEIISGGKGPLPCGCPSTMMKDFRDSSMDEAIMPVNAGESQLRQWPLQLALINPDVPYLQTADIVVAADCVSFSYANLHERFLKNKALIIFCQKLDHNLDMYKEKLRIIFCDNNARSVTTIHMEVPCCSGIVRLTETAIRDSAKNIVIKEYTISIHGKII